MNASIRFCTLALAVGTVAQAATLSTTLTVNATGSVNETTLTVTATGAATMTNVFSGSGTFSGSLSLANSTPAGVVGTFTITPPTGGTITGTVTLPLALLYGLTQGATSGTGSAAITGGTSSFAGYTGSIPTLAGSGSPTSSTSFTLTMTGAGTITTSGGGTSTPTPTITALQNNFSYILPGLPNYGIAPGSLFIIKGTNLNNQALTSLQSSAASGGLPLTLNGTSISVTVAGTTTQPFIYYTSPTQLAAVLPSTTPTGSGTITVTNSGQASAPAPIQVVASAFGIDTLYGTGTGQGVANDPSFNFLLPTYSASPGETINLWGSGVGADTKNANEGTYPLNEDNLTSIPMQVYIGGISAAITYRGRSQYPGVDQVQVVVPTGVASGCFVSVVAVSGTVVSNAVTIPVAATAGGACTDSNVGISASTASSLSGQSSVNFGFLGLLQQVSYVASPVATPNTSNLAIAEFHTESGVAFASSSGTSASIGSCVINAATIATVTAPTLTGLDAGTVTLNGPGGLQTLSPIPTLLGLYEASLPTGYIPAAGGSFTFAGSGGANIGAFSSTVNYPSPLTWTNMSSISAISRASGQSVTWTGGASGSYVQIMGGSTATVGGQSVTVSFTCEAPASAGQFTVPSYILLALPAGTGTLEVNNFTNPATFTAKGLDIGYVYSGWSDQINATYN